PVRTRVSLFDEPNLEFEKRLNRIVKSYDVFSQRDWDELLGAKTPEVYGVQPGDTLWDISQTFFGDGFFWAKLWSQNGVIDNPHKISKGKGIRFIEGNEADAPSIGITETAVLASNSNTISVNALDETVNQPPTYREEVEDEITPEELESGIVLETDELIPAPSIPPASRRAQLLKNLPGSFKEIVPASEIGYDASGLKNVQKIRANEAPTVTLNSFAVDRRPESIGRIEEMETGEELASVGETVLLKLDQPIQVGTSVTFITLRERMSGAPGPTVIVGGVGKIVREISAKKNVYRALVEQSVAGIERGSFVLTQAPPKIVISRRGPRSEIEVSIIGGEYDQNRKILGAGSLVYLNGGASAGLKVGDILGVQSVSDDRRHTKRYPNAARPIGLIKIADVRGKVATAILIESQEEIIVGDRTGGEFPQPKPPVKID
ncbi:MAG: LysM domain-containing protein, partial [Bdellovibrionota bacterium]